MQSACERHCQRRLAAAEGAGPSEAALIGFGDLATHPIDDRSGGRMKNVAVHCIGPADVCIDPDRSLVLARNLNDVRERQFILFSHKRV